MEYGVYLESSSVVSLKPKVLEFLTKLIEKAKDVKDFAITFKKKEIAEEIGHDLSTVVRYLGELESKKIITMKGVRGRSGGTVVMFNADVIHFETSDKALVNSDTPISIDDIVEEKMPKKQKKEPTRQRRTKKQLLEAQVLQNKKQVELDKFNHELALLGTPNWAWFQKTNDPIGNYRTYLITRMYNRFAALFVEDCNYHKLGGELPVVGEGYDILPKAFYGSSKWQQFDKFRNFCEENGIDPAVYLSAQFNRSVYISSAQNKKSGYLPFTNALMSDSSFDVYKQYCQFKAKVSCLSVSFKEMPAMFGNDFVVKTLKDAYNTADVSQGLNQFKGSIEDFLTGEGSTDDEMALAQFFRMTSANLVAKKVTNKTRQTVRKFLLLQSMMLAGGGKRLPYNVILGAEMTQVVLESIKRSFIDKKTSLRMRALALGSLVHPDAKLDEQEMYGYEYLRQYNMLYETPKVLRLVMERKGLALSLADINQAVKEYGKENLPLNDYSFIDDKEIIKLVKAEGTFVESEEIDMKAITRTSEVDFIGAVSDGTDKISQLDNMIDGFFN